MMYKNQEFTMMDRMKTSRVPVVVYLALSGSRARSALTVSTNSRSEHSRQLIKYNMKSKISYNYLYKLQFNFT